jgi:hypothetical protein
MKHWPAAFIGKEIAGALYQRITGFIKHATTDPKFGRRLNRVPIVDNDCKKK